MLKLEHPNHPTAYLIVLLILIIFLLPLPAKALTQATLEWRSNTESNLAGYRVFSRLEEEAFDYSMPLWEGFETSCVVDFPEEEQVWYFVVRVFDIEGYESIDSNEVRYPPLENAGLYDGDLRDSYIDPHEEDSGCFVECVAL